MKKFFKNTSKISIVSLFAVLFLSNVFAASVTPCPTRVPGTTGSYDTQEKCTLDALGFNENKLDLSSFFPSLGFEDFIGTIIAFLFGLLIAFFLIQVLIAGYKWVNNDAQDKSKKDAIKKISNGIIGIIITVLLFVIVGVVRSVIGSDNQLISCASSFYRTGTDFITNHDAGLKNAQGYSSMTVDFRRCISLTGTDYLFKNHDDNNESASRIIGKLDATCAQYYNHAEVISGATNEIKIYDRQALNKCFADQVKSVKNEYKLP